MTNEESATLMGNLIFRGRIKVSALGYATYILGEAVTVPAHNTRVKWAQMTFQQPDQTAMNLQPPVVLDPAVQAAGVAEDGDSNIDDATLQTAVENVVNKSM